MPNWTAPESGYRLVAAFIAVYDLKPFANLDKIAFLYGDGATAKAVSNQIAKIKSDIDQMKLSYKSGTPGEVQPAKSVEKGKDTKSQPKDKSTKSRASTGKSNGVINSRVNKTPRKGAPSGISARAIAMVEEEEDAMVEDENED